MSDQKDVFAQDVCACGCTPEHCSRDGKIACPESYAKTDHELNEMSENRVTISQQDGYSDEDMAAVGRAFMEAIEQARMADEWVKDWAPAQCPSEIIFDMINRFDDASG